MKNKLFIPSLLSALFSIGTAHADCSFHSAYQLTQDLIQDSAVREGYSYRDLKSAVSINDATRITEVLFTFTSESSGETARPQTRVGYAHYDASCGRIESLIANAESNHN